MAHARPNEGIAWECFRYGNTLAILPMNGDMSSVVVTAPANAMPEWMALSAADFAERIEAQFGSRLGSMRLVGERHHYPLVSVHAHRFTAHRFALVGDAAVGMHPVTAQGWNLGLQGVELLARELGAAHRAGHDIGAPGPLAAFEAAHRRATWPLYTGTNALATLFSSESAPSKVVRRAVLHLSAHLPVLSGLVRSMVTRQLTGDLADAGMAATPVRLRPLMTSKGWTR
jgi:2-polyprenyl-6-methoxyphenol hydroxylase-like FAD-dependent oxidoreductase